MVRRGFKESGEIPTKIWRDLEILDHRRQDLDEFAKISQVTRFRKTMRDFGRSGQICQDLRRFGMIWLDWVRVGEIFRDYAKYAKFYQYLRRFERIWRDLATFGKI